MSSHTRLPRRLALTLAASALLLASQAASAADVRASALEHHRAACLLNRPNANVEACVQESLAAREAAREGELRGGDATPYDHNALQRCRALPIADQAACEARMHGRGTVSGSVEEGGILRELVIRERGPATGGAPGDRTAPSGRVPAPAR